MPSNSLDAAYKGVFIRKSLQPQARTNGTTGGSAVDTAEKGGCDCVLAWVTAGTITDGSHAFTVEESADGSTGWAAVPAGRIQGTQPTFTTAGSGLNYEWGVAVSLRYLRISLTVSGATTGGVHASGFVITGSHYEAH